MKESVYNLVRKFVQNPEKVSFEKGIREDIRINYNGKNVLHIFYYKGNYYNKRLSFNHEDCTRIIRVLDYVKAMEFRNM